SIEEKDISATNKSLQKTQRILNYLDSTLDMRYEVSGSLSTLYEFFIHQTVTANVRKDSALLTEIIPMVQELRDSFVQAEKLSRISQNAVAASPTLIGAVG
ncbi:MAG: flagellar export chaperone FliS, partial [Angelakisella sp.]